ncbi:GspE/PulE family protein [Geomonas subterranea]|uniref:GspE/PulE family protein n=1 Tax=Geomonas subterranea TaxID=2847989 RepID=UPI001CD524A6|nr:ATPase, T2SS/T4P/T4SS family [Geomonas fuzhouensis]
MNELTIKLKTGDEIKGVLTRSFKYQDTDVEVLTEGSRETLLFSLDEICYIRFLSPPAGIGHGGSETMEEVQTIAGETFRVSVPANGKFLKGFLGLLPGEGESYQTFFFTDTGVRYRQDARYTGQILQDQGFVSTDKLEAALKQQQEQEQANRGEQDATILLADAVDEGEMHEQAHSNEIHHARVGDILVESGLVTREQVEAAFKSQKGKKLQVGELLIMKGLITEEQLLSALATKFRLRFVDLETVVPAEAALGAISEGLATRLKVFPISLEGRKLVVATCAPTDLTIGDNLRFSTNFAPELVVAPSRQILAAIDKYYRNRIETVDTLLNSMKGEAETVTIEEEADDTRLLFEPDSKIISLVNRILIDAYRRGASDIHFEPGAGNEPLNIRYRIDGECIHAHKVSASYKGAITVRIKIMADLNIAERRRPQSGKILLRYRQQMLEYRVEITPMVGGREGAVLRLLAASKPLPLAGLALLPHNLERFVDILDKPHGIILCVGPTGSGKTTTLHSALGHINTQERKIWTAEDPVEITQAGLCQVQVNAKIGFTFAEALRSFLRADPDVIMIGEMRDAETSKIAIEASLTGHLVFSTLHTNSAPEAAVRLIEMGMDPFNFSDALLGIVAQRLAKRLCSACKRPARDQRQRYDEVVASLGQIVGERKEVVPDFKEANFMTAVGCEECGGTGYKGRIALHELMVGTDKVKTAIRRGVGMDELRGIAMDEGMWTLKMDGLVKVLQGETDLEQILKVCM